jgi:hypothetical protein
VHFFSQALVHRLAEGLAAMRIALRAVPPSARQDCVTVIMPLCVQAMFTGLTSEQHNQLARTMTINITTALRRVTH